MENALACDCGHGVAWHHDTRGCGYLGYTPDHRCPCRLLPHEAVAALMARAWDEGYRARSGEGWQSPGADNPYYVIPPGVNR